MYHTHSYLGCDSVITFALYSNPISVNIIDTTICGNTTYHLPNGQVVNQPGTYSDTFQNYVGCDSIVIVNLKTNPTSNFFQDIHICSNENFTLPNGQVVNQSNTYQTHINNYKGCDSLITTLLEVTPQPLLNLGADTALCDVHQFTLNATVNNANAIYTWNDLSTHPVKLIDSSGVYGVSVVVPYCPAAQDEILVRFIDCQCHMVIYTAFTPNADGNNDYYKPLYACDLMPKNYSLAILNRWGQTVFSTTDFNTAWDGNFNGEPQPKDVYVYLLNWTDTSGKVQYKTGNITLLR